MAWFQFMLGKTTINTEFQVVGDVLFIAMATNSTSSVYMRSVKHEPMLYSCFSRKSH